jgi:hypothetical protein
MHARTRPKNGRKRSEKHISYFHFHIFYRMETKMEMPKAKMNGHIWLVENELNQSGLYQKWLVTGNQVRNIDPT